MAVLILRFKCIVAAFAVAMAITGSVHAQETDLDALFTELREADEGTHARVADRIRARFEQSGSASMDLLLRRGNEAAEQGDFAVAVEHYTAVVDHAPDFAEGYHSRASAYFGLGLIGPALDDLRQTLVLNPRHFEAMFGVGIMLEELGRDADAIAAYRAIQEVYPLDPDAATALERMQLKTEGQAI